MIQKKRLLIQARMAEIKAKSPILEPRYFLNKKNGSRVLNSSFEGKELIIKKEKRIVKAVKINTFKLKTRGRFLEGFFT